ncbi:MAG: hypothetical protein Q9160_003503 [Pyrenula sp. 1 TL-2023]
MVARVASDLVRSHHTSLPLKAARLPPSFLAPALLSRPATHPTQQRPRQFTNTSLLSGLRYRQLDNNPSRGVSAIRRTGPKHKGPMQGRLEKHKLSLPKPIEPEALKTDPDHGLWGFFPSDKQPMVAPEDDNAHGRAWTDAELANKSWEDLHRLHWVCVKERCRIATTSKERDRLNAGFGEFEANERDEVVRTTQKRIKQVLRTRWHSFNQARDLWSKGHRGEVSFEDVPPEEEEFASTEPIQKERDYHPNHKALNAEKRPSHPKSNLSLSINKTPTLLSTPSQQVFGQVLARDDFLSKWVSWLAVDGMSGVVSLRYSGLA